MNRFVNAILRAMRNLTTKTAKSLVEHALHVATDLVNFPGRVLMGAAGLTGRRPLPEQKAEFETPGDLANLVEKLDTPARPATIRDFDRDGVNSVFKLAKMTKVDRAIADLSAIERADVRALLFSMTTSELQALTAAGPGAVRLLITDGDSKVWGVPSVAAVPTAAVMPHVQSDLAERLRNLKAAMAAPKGSLPFQMPRM